MSRAEPSYHERLRRRQMHDPRFAFWYWVMRLRLYWNQHRGGDQWP